MSDLDDKMLQGTDDENVCNESGFDEVSVDTVGLLGKEPGKIKKFFKRVKLKLDDLLTRHFSQNNVRRIKKVTKLTIRFGLLVFLMFCFLSYESQKIASRNKQDNAAKVLELMYNFGTFEQQQEQFVKIRQYTTGAVYRQLTQDVNEEKLSTYVGMVSNRCKIDIEVSRDNYVIYSLITAGIEKGRKFIFCYDVDNTGRICKVTESELMSLYEE